MFTKQSTFRDSLFYDISAWTFPYAFNLNHSIESNSSLIGKQFDEITPPKGKVTSKATYAYLFEAHNYYIPKLLNHLQQNNVRVKVGLTPFTLNGKRYDYGTYMIPVKNQEVTEDALFSILQEGAQASHIIIHSSKTGYTDGIDLGSRDFTSVKKPEIALLVGDGVRSYDAGEIWHLLDTRHKK